MSFITLGGYEWYTADRQFESAPAQEEEEYEEGLIVFLGFDPDFAHWCAEKARQLAEEDAL